VGPLWAHLTKACVGLKGSVLATWARRTKPLRPSRPAQGETLRKCSRGKGETCPPLHPLAAGPRARRRGQAGHPAPYIRDVWGAASPSPNPSRRPISAPPLPSLATAHRRSPDAEILHHKNHAIVLLIQSISPPYLLDQGRRRHRCTVRVQLSEASPLAALDRIGSRGGDG
jgi:hypothetical protein